MITRSIHDLPYLSSVSSSVCPFAVAWAARVVANGGAAPSKETQTAICAFQTGLVSDGLDTKMIAWNAIVPDNLVAATTPQLVGSGGNDPWTNHNFVGGDLTVNGLTGDASTKYLDSGIRRVLSPFGIAGYVYNATQTGCSVGGTNGTSFWANVMAKYVTGNYFMRIGLNTQFVSNPTPGNGWFSSQRVSTTDFRAFFANSGNAHTQLGATDTSLYTGGSNLSSAVTTHSDANAGNQFFSSDTISAVFITTGLTPTEDAALFARVQTLRQALGGGFV